MDGKLIVTIEEIISIGRNLGLSKYLLNKIEDFIKLFGSLSKVFMSMIDPSDKDIATTKTFSRTNSNEEISHIQTPDTFEDSVWDTYKELLGEERAGPVTMVVLHSLRKMFSEVKRKLISSLYKDIDVVVVGSLSISHITNSSMLVRYVEEDVLLDCEVATLVLEEQRSSGYTRIDTIKEMEVMFNEHQNNWSLLNAVNPSFECTVDKFLNSLVVEVVNIYREKDYAHVGA